jgi:hypothetical protein
MYGLKLLQLEMSIKCMFYTSLHPITKEIKVFLKTDISITLNIFYDFFLIAYKTPIYRAQSQGYSHIEFLVL